MSAVWSPQRVLLAVVVLASVALIFVVGTQYRATDAAGESVVRGQAESLHAGVRALMPLEPGELERFQLEHEGQGLRYVGIELPTGFVEAGTAQIDAPDQRPGELVQRLERVRSVVPGPPPRGPLGLGPPPGPRGPGPRGFVAIEFEPLAWVELQAAARQQLIGGIFVLVALWIAFLLGWRAIGRSAAQAVSLAEQKRLAMLGEMSATLAHEIRNPLTALKGHAQLMLEDTSDDKSRARSQRIVDEAIRLENLTSDLFSFLRSGDISVSESDPVELVKDVCDARPNIELRTEDAPKSWEFDADRVRQALSNLIENAMQAGDGKAEVTVLTGDDTLRFEVADRGKGIDDAVKKRLFEPFVTSRTRGMGLGLTVARRVAQSHGGDITAEARAGGGSRFILTIPKPQNNRQRQ